METKEVALVQPNNIVSLAKWDELLSRAEYLAKSELVPAALKGKPANVAIILQIGCELGISPMQAINGVSVIQGKPGVDPQLAIALIRQRIPSAVIKFKCADDRAEVTMARSRETMDEAYTAVWTMEKARRMQLDKKDNYIKQPGTMLRWRAVMEAARAVFPDVIKGMYSPEEVESFGNENASDDKAKRLQALAKPATVEVQAEVTTAPAVEVVTPEVVEPETKMDPLGTYICQADGPLKGQKLESVLIPTLTQFVQLVQLKSRKDGKAITGKLLEDVTRMEQYLEQFGVKTPEQESFDAFQGTTISN